MLGTTAVLALGATLPASTQPSSPYSNAHLATRAWSKERLRMTRYCIRSSWRTALAQAAGSRRLCGTQPARPAPCCRSSRGHPHVRRLGESGAARSRGRLRGALRSSTPRRIVRTLVQTGVATGSTECLPGLTGTAPCSPMPLSARTMLPFQRLQQGAPAGFQRQALESGATRRSRFFVREPGAGAQQRIGKSHWAGLWETLRVDHPKSG
jgi:hypothetical protein